MLAAGEGMPAARVQGMGRRVGVERTDAWIGLDWGLHSLFTHETPKMIFGNFYLFSKIHIILSSVHLNPIATH